MEMRGSRRQPWRRPRSRFSALPWLGVVVTYLWIATWAADLLILLLALTAVVYGSLAGIRRVRSVLSG